MSTASIITRFVENDVQDARSLLLEYWNHGFVAPLDKLLQKARHLRLDVEDIVQRVWLAKTERHAIARAAQARLIANTNLSAVQAVNAYDLFECDKLRRRVQTGKRAI